MPEPLFLRSQAGTPSSFTIIANQYRKFNLLGNLQVPREAIWSNTNYWSRLASAQKKVDSLRSTTIEKTVGWTNELQKAEFTLLSLERDKANIEEFLYRVWMEYKKPNPLSFIPDVKVREHFLKQVNKLGDEDRKQLSRIESETKDRRKNLKLDFEAMKKTIETSEQVEKAPRRAAVPAAADFKLPKPD